MTPLRRISVLAAVVLLTTLPATAGGRKPSLTLEPYLHETDSHGEIAAERGTLRVAESRHSPNSPRLDLVLVRLPARDEAPNKRPIVYLAGGPGSSGIGAGEGDRFRLFDALRSVGDVILLDQRSTGASTSIDPEECPLESLYPPDQPFDLDRYLSLVEANAAACARYWAERGVDLSAYTTLDSSADLEDLRIALGVEQFDLLGISYGTHLALAYMRQHPQRVRTAVLAGVEGPDHTVKLPRQFDAQFRHLEALASSTAEEEGELRRLVRLVRSRLETEPVTLRLTSVEGPDATTHLVAGWREVAAITQNLLQDPSGMMQLPALFGRLAIGDFTDIAGALQSQRRVGGLEAMPEAMDAASGISEQRLATLMAEDRTTLFGSGVLLANVAVTSGLGVPDLGESYRAPLTSDVRTLFVSGSLDGRTPTANAEELMRGFSRASHVEVVHGGHGNDLLIATPQLEQLIVNFFRHRDPAIDEIVLPQPDTQGLRIRAPLSPQRAQRYVGEYERRDREIWRVLHHRTVETLDPEGQPLFSNAVLQIRWNGDGFPLHPVSEETFYIDFPWFIDTDFVFEFDDAGRVTHLSFVDSAGETVRMEKVH